MNGLAKLNLYIIAGIFATPLLQGCEKSGVKTYPVEVSTPLQAESKLSTNPRDFSAAGSIEPLDGIHRLGAPILSPGLVPRVAKLYVEEGVHVKKGQVLARFDSYDTVSKRLNTEDSTINGLKQEILLLERQTERFRVLETKGAIDKAHLEERELRLTQLQNKLVQSQARRLEILEELKLSELFAPISGIVLSIQTRNGEQASITNGVLDIANHQDIGAVVQVDERNVPLLRPGQAVIVTSENGYFSKPIRAYVASIGSRITYRRSLSTKPGSEKDSEPRVVDVDLAFSKDSPKNLDTMVGAKIVARFLTP